MNLPNRLFILITGPSGTGKDALMRGIMQHDTHIASFTNATTRSPRADEIAGVSYHFLTIPEFEAKIKNNEFLEYSQHYTNYYGSLTQELLTHFNKNHDAICDLNYTGVKILKEKIPQHILSILVMPPSLESLEARFENRRQKSKEDWSKYEERLKKIRFDFQHLNTPNYVFTNDDMVGSKLTDYDHIVVNDQLDKATNEILIHIQNTRKKQGRA